MPGGLKSLELQGYKTFANRTLFEFAEKVTAIVGPNGSGKSNIADSLRWVLGEQSYTLLRGKKTEDMIFSGSELRPRSSMAAATVTFDNQDNWLPIDFSEVAITRRAYRDGTNEYLINGQRVRLKDVSELLAQSGLAERTYTIIGQGLVDAALALKAEDRRKLFEEAAGIGLYRARREEALRRMETTRRNLERVEDILTELEPRMRSLERQARRAQEYEQVKNDLQLLLRDWYGYHWHRAQQELMEARDVEKAQSTALEKSRAEQIVLDAQLMELRQRIQNRRQELNEWLRQSAEFHAQREVIHRDLAVADERTHFFETQAQNTQDELARLEDERNLQHELVSSVNLDILRIDGELKDARTQVEQARQAYTHRQRERSQIDGQVQEARQKQSTLNARQGQLQARLAESKAQLERDHKTLEEASQAVKRAQQEQEEADLRQQDAQEQLSKTVQTLRLADEALQVKRQELAEAETQRKQLMTELSQSKADLERYTARWEIIEQAEVALTGYPEGTRRLLQAVRDERLPGKPGALNHYMEVPVDLEQAISAALGEFLQAVLLDTDLENALSKLEDGAGRGALLPLAYLKTARSFDPIQYGLPGLLEEENDWIGAANELVQTSADLRPAVDLLLGSVWVVRDRYAARAILQKLVWGDQVDPDFLRLRIVTLAGEVFYASGAMLTSSGLSEEKETNLLSRQRQRKELEALLLVAKDHTEVLSEKLIALADDIDLLQSTADNLAQEQRSARLGMEENSLGFQQARLAAEQASRQMGWQQEQAQRMQDQIKLGEAETERLSGELGEVEAQLNQAREYFRERSAALAGLVLDEFQTQLAHWETRTAVAERSLADERRRLEERQLAVGKTIARIKMLEQRLVEYQYGKQSLIQEKEIARVDEKRITQSTIELQQKIEPVESELIHQEKEQGGLEEAETAARQTVSLADHRHAQSRIVLARRQEALQSLQRRIEEDFGLVAFYYDEQVSGQSPLPLEGMVEKLPRLVDLAPEIEEAIKRQRAQLRRIGPINPEAQAEYRSVVERFNFMTEQIADSRRAEEDIREVIHELDGLMQREFNKTFEAVAAEFKAIFQRLFGGGTARLVLTDPDNLAETGIDIEARLPGRRTQGLSLLSGGERSLTATSLVFALLKVSPTPFCVLDEVDAMLDEANVGRFRDLLRELSQRTQFIIVTHNRNTVQAADIIYGVTMGRDSASQVVSLKLDQVAEVFE